MKLKWKFKGAIGLGALAVILAGCSGNLNGMDHSQMNMQGGKQSPNLQKSDAKTVNTAVLTGTDFDLTAMVSNQELAPGKTLPVWTYNNSVPGPEIRVKQGDTVKINLKNELPEPVTIHWHGVPVPNNMDGIPGVTQNAVQPGKSFTYEFKAEVPGTYWYHSHQDSVNQVDRGLYGSFIVEGSNEEKVDRDYVLMLDEWVSTGMGMDIGTGMDMSGNMSGMDHSQMNGTMSGMEHDMNMYDLYTMNGKSGSLVNELPVKEGDKVRLRLINAGYKPHQIHLHGHEFKVTATDGQPINIPGLMNDNAVNIGPGERYDIEFIANNPGQWLLEEHGTLNGVAGMKAVLAYENADIGTDKSNSAENLPILDLTRYGQSGNNIFSLDQKFDWEYSMDLNTEMKDGAMVYTINGKTFPNTDMLSVKKGGTVKVRLKNKSADVDHPMHLHGHFFQVLSKNGTPLKGSPVIKDTLNIKPGEEYVVAFVADNPGDWMFHCHELHHASAGMVTELLYSDFKSDFVADPNAGNKPE